MTTLLLTLAFGLFPPLHSKPPCRGAILWTFDDGPHRRSVPHLLRLIRQYRLGRTVWFVLGAQLQHPGNVKALEAVVADSHALANHLYTHRSPCKLGARGVRRELLRTKQLLDRLVPKATRLKWYRPPFGAQCYRHVPRRLGYRLVMWHVADIGYHPKTMLRQIWRRTTRGLPTVVLVHHNWTKFRALLRLLRARGCLGGNTHGTKRRGEKVPGVAQRRP